MSMTFYVMMSRIPYDVVRTIRDISGPDSHMICSTILIMSLPFVFFSLWPESHMICSAILDVSRCPAVPFILCHDVLNPI